MPKLVGDHVSLSKFPRRAKPPLQLVVKIQIDIHFFVAGTVERPGSLLRCTASRVRGVAEQHQRGMVIRFSGLLRKQLHPGILRVVQNKRHKLRQRFFRRILGGVRMRRARLADTGTCRRRRSSAQQRKKICVEDETQNQKNNRAADAQVYPAERESTASAVAAGFIPAVFHVLIVAVRCPFHGTNSSKFFARMPAHPERRNGNTEGPRGRIREIFREAVPCCAESTMPSAQLKRANLKIEHY